MKISRFKWTIRLLVSFIVVIAMATGVYVMFKRADDFQVLSSSFAKLSLDWRWQEEMAGLELKAIRSRAPKEGLSEGKFREIQFWESAAHYNRNGAEIMEGLARKYRYAATHPWKSVAHDPPLPEWKVLPPTGMSVDPRMYDYYKK